MYTFRMNSLCACVIESNGMYNMRCMQVTVTHAVGQAIEHRLTLRAAVKGMLPSGRTATVTSRRSAPIVSSASADTGTGSGRSSSAHAVLISSSSSCQSHIMGG